MKKVNKSYQYEIISQHGKHRSYHKTYEAAEERRIRNLGYHCGICGSNKSGWGTCKHGRQNIVCSAYYYNDRVIRLEAE